MAYSNFSTNHFMKCIDELKEKHNLKTDKQFAEKIGVDASIISRWINGKQNPTLNQIMDIASVFEVSSDWLLGLKDETSSRNIKLETMSDIFQLIFALVDYENNFDIKSLHFESDDSFCDMPEEWKQTVMFGLSRVLKLYYHDSADQRYQLMMDDADAYYEIINKTHPLSTSDRAMEISKSLIEKSLPIHKKAFRVQHILCTFTESLEKLFFFNDEDILNLYGDIYEKWKVNLLEESRNYDVYGNVIDPDGYRNKMIDGENESTDKALAYIEEVMKGKK